MASRLPSKGIKGKQQTVTNGYLTVHRMPKSGLADAYRNIRTKLIFSSPDKELKTLLVTSAVPGEGKTFTTVSLCTVVAQTGKRVLLVDADMRRPCLGKTFSLGSPAESIGLSSLIMKRVSPEEAIVKTEIENLSVLPAGPRPPNPSELLGSESMRQLLEKLGSAFDLVALDTPPVLGLPDTLSLVSKVDGCILVIQSYKTSYKNVLRAREAIEMVKGRILGALLNKVKPEPFGYYYGGYHGYYHGYYYHHYEEVENPEDVEGLESEETRPKKKEGLGRP